MTAGTGAQLKAAVIGVWHVHARDYVKETLARDDVELLGVWDANAAAAAAFAESYGVSVIPTLDEILEDTSVSVVLVTTSTADHGEIIARALQAGKHVFTEKVLAADLATAGRLYDEAAQAGRLLFLSLQRLREPWVLTSKELLENGTLGMLTASRIRYQHGGASEGWLPEVFYSVEEAQGGVVIDLGAHGFYLSQLLHGAYPSSLTAVASKVTGRAVEDNSVVILSYPDGSLSVLETSLVSPPYARQAELFGTEGYVSVDSREDTVYLRPRDVDGVAGGFAAQPTPEQGETPLAEFYGLVAEGAVSAAENRADALRLTALVEAAYAAVETGRAQETVDPLA